MAVYILKCTQLEDGVGIIAEVPGAASVRPLNAWHALVAIHTLEVSRVTTA